MMSSRLVLQERCKPRLEAVLFADYGEVTTEGKIVLVDIFNRIVIDPKDRGAPGGIGCSLFVRTVETVEEPIWIKLVDPTGALVDQGLGDDPAWLVGETPWPRHLQTLRRLVFRPLEAGLYVIDVSYKGQSLGGTHLIIEFGKPEVPSFH